MCQQKIPEPDWLWVLPAAITTGEVADTVTKSLTIRGQNGELARPNVRDPGTDFSDFPNSAEVVPVGEFYMSMGWNYVASRAPQVTDNFVPFAFRFGIVEDVELRITGDGVTQEDGPDYNQTGFSPLSLGFKWHLLDQQEERYLPALGLEVDVDTRLASAFFDPGHAVPVISFNFDQPLPGNWSLGWNTGVTWQVDDDGDQFAQWNLPWSVVYSFNDDFELYWQGLLNLPASSAVQQELLTGIGFNAYLSDQWEFWGNYNWGLTQQSDFRCVLVGLTFAGNLPQLADWQRGY
jgi:hypothetical protein